MVYFSNLVAWLLLTGGESGLHGYSPLVERVGCMVTPRWWRGWVAWLLPAGGAVGCMATSCWGSWFLVTPAGEVGFQDFFPLGEKVGCMVTLRWGRGWVQWLWSSCRRSWFHGTYRWGRGWVHVYSPLGERVGEMVLVFPLGKLVLWYSQLGEREVHGYLPAGGEGYLFVKLIPVLFVVV